ncbi:hypothetical protein ALMP_80550, partial [Streptomyces sp. A012304]
GGSLGSVGSSARNHPYRWIVHGASREGPNCPVSERKATPRDRIRPAARALGHRAGSRRIPGPGHAARPDSDLPHRPAAPRTGGAARRDRAGRRLRHRGAHHPRRRGAGVHRARPRPVDRDAGHRPRRPPPPPRPLPRVRRQVPGVDPGRLRRRRGVLPGLLHRPRRRPARRPHRRDPPGAAPRRPVRPRRPQPAGDRRAVLHPPLRRTRRRLRRRRHRPHLPAQAERNHRHHRLPLPLAPPLPGPPHRRRIPGAGLRPAPGAGRR